MKTLITLILLIVTPATWAQCTGAGDSGVQCFSPDIYAPTNTPNPQPQQPQAVWASRYGAVAYDSVSGAEGHITDQTSKAQAESTVLSLCAQHGGANCKVIVSYYNQCAAVAQVSGGGLIGTGNALHSQQAEQLAMEACEKGASNCKIVYSACSLPIRVQ